jgi:hypothetical protein
LLAREAGRAPDDERDAGFLENARGRLDAMQRACRERVRGLALDALPEIGGSPGSPGRLR